MYDKTLRDESYIATKLCTFSIVSATSRHELLVVKDKITSFRRSHSAAAGLLVGRGMLRGWMRDAVTPCQPRRVRTNPTWAGFLVERSERCDRLKSQTIKVHLYSLEIKI
jgi:hypothetical protein